MGESVTVTQPIQEEDRYILGQDNVEVQRLDAQHKALKEVTGGLVAKPIWDNLMIQPEDLHIADLATGTGIWLIDLNQELLKAGKHAILAGHDITDVKFPISLPSNFEMSVHDILTSPTPDVVGKFDFIHLRLLAAFLLEGQHRLVVENCIQMLKPGGYLQWDDITPAGMMNNANIFPHLTGFKEWADRVYAKVVEAQNVPKDGFFQVLPICKELGLEECTETIYLSSNNSQESTVALTVGSLHVIDEISRAALRVPMLRDAIGPEMTKERLEALSSKIKGEYGITPDKTRLEWVHIVVYARKPTA